MGGALPLHWLVYLCIQIRLAPSGSSRQLLKAQILNSVLEAHEPMGSFFPVAFEAFKKHK